MEKRHLDIVDTEPLQELEPSPIDEFPPELSDAEKGQFFPTPEPSSNGYGGNRLISWLLKTQKYTTYPPSVFALFHITNTSLIPLVTQSVPDSESFLLLTRPYYQSAYLEPLLLTIPILTHIAAGVTLRLVRRSRSARRYGAETHAERRHLKWPRLSWQSMGGYLFTPLLFGHVLLNRAVPLIRDGDSSGVGLAYVAHGFARHPVFANLGYLLFVTVGVGHIVGGWATWLGLSVQMTRAFGEEGKRIRTRRFWGLVGTVVAVAGVWLAGGLGVVGRGGATGGWVGKGWDEMYSSVPIIGEWLC